MFPFIRLSKYLLISLILLAIVLPLASVQGQECAPPECDPPPPDSMPSQPKPVTINNSAGSVWEGFTDGRLNPAYDEYYSVWCQDNVLRVLRGVPNTAFVDDIPLGDVEAMADGSSLTRVSGLTLTRSADTITIYGSNGNLSTEGSKSFLLPECLARNGEVVITNPDDRLQTLGNNEQQTLPIQNDIQATPEVTAEPTAEATSEPGGIGSQAQGLTAGAGLPDDPSDLYLPEWCGDILTEPCDFNNDGVIDLSEFMLSFLFFLLLCPGNLLPPTGFAVFMIPAGWAKWRGRKRNNTREMHEEKRG